jgi:FAD-dependent urate hydroxylase
VNWLERSGRLHQSALRRLLYPDTDVGPPILNQIVNKPRLFGRFPEPLRERMADRAIRPAAAGWLRPRLADVTITCGRSVVAASADGSGASVRLDDGSERRVDHVLAGTGFRLDVARHPLLADGIRSRVRGRGGYPELGRGYESSVPGLHFLGALSAKSYGPVMRFVSGTWATGPVLARAIAGAQASARTAAPPPTALRDAEQPSW